MQSSFPSILHIYFCGQSAVRILCVSVKPWWSTVPNNVCFLLRITLEERNLMRDVFINFVLSIGVTFTHQTVCFKVIHSIIQLTYIIYYFILIYSDNTLQPTWNVKINVKAYNYNVFHLVKCLVTLGTVIIVTVPCSDLC